MNRLAAFIHFCKERLTCIHSPSTTAVSGRLPNTGSRLIGRRTNFQKPSMGTTWRGERQMV